MKEFLKSRIVGIMVLFVCICILGALCFNIKLNILQFHLNETYKTKVLEEYDRVAADYDEYIKINPFDMQAYYNRGYANYKANKYDEALPDFKKYKKFGKKNADLYRYIGNIYSSYSNDEALAVYQKGLKKFPNDAKLLNNIAYTKLLNNDDLQDALNYVNKSLSIATAPEAYHTRAEIERNLGMHQLAISDCDKALEMKQDTWYCNCEKGFILMTFGQIDEGMRNLHICKQRSLEDNDYKYKEIYDRFIHE